jgi:hypothetical protein
MFAVCGSLFAVRDFVRSRSRADSRHFAQRRYNARAVISRPSRPSLMTERLTCTQAQVRRIIKAAGSNARKPALMTGGIRQLACCLHPQLNRASPVFPRRLSMLSPSENSPILLVVPTEVHETSRNNSLGEGLGKIGPIDLQGISERPPKPSFFERPDLVIESGMIRK